MSHLYLSEHMGDQRISRSELFALPQPVAKGPRHQPVHHADFVESLEEAFRHHGFEQSEQEFGITHDGNRFFGLSRVVHESLKGIEGYDFLVGFRGSHDQSLPRGISAGSHVMVCSNLCFWGDFVVSTKQTTKIHERLPVLLDDLVVGLPTVFRRQTAAFTAYQKTMLPDTIADAAITEMGRRGIINWGELGKVVQEWDEPSHDEHAQNGKNVLQLFNAATETLKLRNSAHPRLTRTIEQGPKLHGLCNELVALAA